MDDRRERQKLLHRWFYLQLRMKHLKEEVQGLSKWLSENRKVIEGDAKERRQHLMQSVYSRVRLNDARPEFKAIIAEFREVTGQLKSRQKKDEGLS